MSVNMSVNFEFIEMLTHLKNNKKKWILPYKSLKDTYFFNFWVGDPFQLGFWSEGWVSGEAI